MSSVAQGTIYQHLSEFRRRLWIAVTVFAGASALCFLFVDRILDFLISPILPKIGQIYFFSPTDAFTVKIKAALLAGALLSSPVILSQLWLFVSPALHTHEKKAVLPLAVITTLLFLSGALFSFFTVIPMTLDFLIGQQTTYLKPMVSMPEYISFLSGMMISFGVAFNLPVFVLALVAAKVTTVRGLNRLQRHAVVIIVIAAAILTPGPDIASQLALAIPMFLLFEISILAAWILETVTNRRGMRRVSR